jgi:hypothetical protein
MDASEALPETPLDGGKRSGIGGSLLELGS